MLSFRVEVKQIDSFSVQAEATKEGDETGAKKTYSYN